MTQDMDRAQQRRWALLLRRAVKSGRIPPVRGHSVALRLKLNIPPVAIIDQQLFNALFGAVESGRFTPARAEAIAARLGLPKLNPPPAYDPANVDRWTLPMALAWIAYRDLGEVARWAGEYRDQARIWAPAGRPFLGKVLHDRWGISRPSIDETLRHITLDRAYSEAMHLEAQTIPAQTKALLWKALGDGLQAVGYSAGALVEIPKYQWSELEPMALPDEPCALAFRRSLAPAYHGVTVSRVDLLASFKTTSKVVENAEPKAIAAPRYEEFREAMTARIKDDPQKIKPENARMTKLEVKRWAANEFGLSGEATEAERASIMRTLKGFAHVWDKGGRPRKTAV